MFGSMGRASQHTSMLFLSRAAVDNRVAEQLEQKSLVGAVSGCRTISKADMIGNSYLPNIEVDAQTYEVRADGELLTCEPAEVLPLAQRYFLF